MNYSIRHYFINVYFRSFLVAGVAAILPVVFVSIIESSLFRLIGTCIISVVSTALFVYTIGISTEIREKVNQIIMNRIAICRR